MTEQTQLQVEPCYSYWPFTLHSSLLSALIALILCDTTYEGAVLYFVIDIRFVSKKGKHVVTVSTLYFTVVWIETKRDKKNTKQTPGIYVFNSLLFCLSAFRVALYADFNLLRDEGGFGQSQRRLLLSSLSLVSFWS